MFQPAGWIGDASPRIHQDCSVTERGLGRIIEWHVEPRRQMTSQAYVAHKMVESHKVATLTPVVTAQVALGGTELCALRRAAAAFK